MKRNQKTKPVGFKVIRGGGQGLEKAQKPVKTPLFFILLFLALFLLAQILTGWIWGMFGQRSIQTISAGEGSLEQTFPISGLVTFEEEIILSPRSGFVNYLIEEGSRVPVGVELARISDFPPEEAVSAADEEEQNTTDYLMRFKDWFLGSEAAEDRSSFTPKNGETTIINPQAGLVSFNFDGWERFGPGSSFPYLTEEEFNEKPSQEQHMGSGQKVSCFSPLLRIINNYTWYFSAVFPAASGEILAEQPQVLLYFSFSPDCPVIGEQVEVRKDGEVLQITWAINQHLENFYNQRWCQAEIVYGQIEGTMIPRNTLIEKDDKKGVYIIEKGIISFCEVQILGEKEDLYLVENLDPHENVVLSPDKIKEGQRFSW